MLKIILSILILFSTFNLAEATSWKTIPDPYWDSTITVPEDLQINADTVVTPQTTRFLEVKNNNMSFSFAYANMMVPFDSYADVSDKQINLMLDAYSKFYFRHIPGIKLIKKEYTEFMGYPALNFIYSYPSSDSQSYIDYIAFVKGGKGYVYIAQAKSTNGFDGASTLNEVRENVGKIIKEL